MPGGVYARRLWAKGQAGQERHKKRFVFNPETGAEETPVVLAFYLTRADWAALPEKWQRVFEDACAQYPHRVSVERAGGVFPRVLEALAGAEFAGEERSSQTSLDEALGCPQVVNTLLE